MEVGSIVPNANGDTARQLIRFAIRSQRRWLIPASTFLAIHQGCEAAVPLMIGVVVDQAIAPGSTSGLLWTFAVMAALFLVLTTSMRLSGRLVRHATQGAEHEIRLRLTGRILATDGLDPKGVRTGEVLSTATSDAARVGMVNAAVWTSFGAAGALVVAAVVLLQASLLLGLVVLLGLVPVVLLSRTISAPLEARSSVEQAAAAKAAGVATDLVEGLRVIKGLGAELVAYGRYRAASQDSRSAAVRAATVLAMRTGMILLLTGVFVAVVAFIGGRLASTGSITIGQFVTAITLTQFLVGPFTRIAMVGAWFARSSASARRIAAVLDAPPVVRTATPADAPPGVPELRLRGLTGPGLRGIDLDVAAGEFLGVVIADQVAADTLLRCLGRQIDPESGGIELAGVPMAMLDPDIVRSVVLVAGHDAVLFRGTVARNISAEPGALAQAAIDCADVAEVAGVLPDGMDTLITERGRSLSGGQRQRVALARALAADAPVLVLHEPTTAVDAVTEARIAGGLRTMRAGRSTIAITTSPSLLAVADRVVVIDDGALAGVGTHAEQVREDARYRELVLA